MARLKALPGAVRNRSDKVSSLPKALSHCRVTCEKLPFSYANSVVKISWQGKLKSTQVLTGYFLVGPPGRCTRRFTCKLWGIERRRIPVIQTRREHNFTYVHLPARRANCTFSMAAYSLTIQSPEGNVPSMPPLCPPNISYVFPK